MRTHAAFDGMKLMCELCEGEMGPFCSGCTEDYGQAFARDARTEAFEEAAKYMEQRAADCQASAGGGPTQSMMARIFRDEAQGIRALKGGKG